MIGSAVFFAALAVALGVGLATKALRGGRAGWWARAAHGIVGALALLALVWALDGPPRGVRSGAGGFGVAAAWLLAAALALGVALAFWRRAPPGVVIAAHAGLAITGVTLLLAWAQLP
jgi:hypothetical protein